MTDGSEIGCYGTLRLLKRHGPDRDTTVAFFPIDDSTVSFGRSKQCSVRLYYACVSELHCTLHISDERKAFLIVQGTNGLLVDGCEVRPPATVPLTNGSEIEIYKKRFRFEYPPKEIRAALLATPRRARRSLRMSLIRSAQVLTPRASPVAGTPRRGCIRDNAEWEALRSPVRVPQEGGAADEEMLLLEGPADNAVVVEEEKDLIILEHVDSREEGALSITTKPPLPGRAVAFSTPPPRRRSAPSLHRAVVLRSAQRAHLERERERERWEDEREEVEVEAVVSPERDLGPFELEREGGDAGYDDEFDDDEGGDEGAAYEDDAEEDAVHTPVVPSNAPARMGVLRAGFDVVKKALPSPFGWRAGAGEQDHVQELEQGEDEEEDEEPYEADEDTVQTHTPVRRNLGPFMTPQVWVNRPAQRVPVDVAPQRARASVGGEGVRASIGGEGVRGAGAQRVRVVPPWKIRDIVLPAPTPAPAPEPEPEKPQPRVSEEERRAIYARRKSALTAPHTLPPPGPRTAPLPAHSRDEDAYTPGADADEDAATMLQRMSLKMAGVRRRSEARRSVLGGGGRGSPEKGVGRGRDFSLLAGGGGRSAEVEERGSADELDGPTRTPNAGPGSLTPRFDGIRQMFRPRAEPEPETPSFVGFRRMFQPQPQGGLPPKTPSFAGFRKMFREPGPELGFATPRMELGEVFGEEEEGEGEEEGEKEGEGDDSEGTSDDPMMLHSEPEAAPTTAMTIIKSEAHYLSGKPGPAPGTKKRSVAAVNVPSAVFEDAVDQEQEQDEDEEAARDLDMEPEPEPAPEPRRAKRSVKKTTPATEDTGESSGAVRSTRKTEGVVVHKTRTRTKTKTGRARRVVAEESEDDVPAKPKKRSTRNRDQDEAAVEASYKAKGAETSDADGPPAPRARRGRPAKTHVEPEEPAPVPTTTAAKGTRRVKTEVSADVELAPVKPRRGAAKAREAEDDTSENLNPGLVSEPEDATPAPSTGRSGAKKGTTKKTGTPAPKELDDKENAGSKPVGRRARRAPAAAVVEALDAPAKRTRSRK